MAPVTTMPHKANNHQRYLPEKTTNTSKTAPDFTLEESDTEEGALQPVRETEWEGFGAADGTKDRGDEEESDVDSSDAGIEEKKQEKPILPKDAEEEELERIIFGDSAGFKQGLADFSLGHAAGAYGDVSDEDEGEGDDLEAVADQDLFFFDAGPAAAPAGSVAAAKAVESEDEDDKPAWEDSDDERLVVSLASVPQLKKLRESVDDDMVNGKEYSRRLRKQYERLYPAPEWALHATGKAHKKRRRTMDEDESGEGSASDMDTDEDDRSAQPLARLLKDADILSRTARGPVKRRKLQAGTVDIQRLKDVSKAGPVSTSADTSLEKLLTLLSVCHHLTLVPPCLPASPLIRPQLDALPASRQSEPTYAKPASDLSPHETHASHHDRIPSLGVGLSYILERPPPVFPRVERCYGQGREGFAHLRASA
jgi:U3 small nucleolar RNA-associated protein 18